MLQLRSINHLPSSSAAVARARLHIALHNDRRSVIAATTQPLVARPARSERVDALLGRLLSEASYE